MPKFSKGNIVYICTATSKLPSTENWKSVNIEFLVYKAKILRIGSGYRSWSEKPLYPNEHQLALLDRVAAFWIQEGKPHESKLWNGKKPTSSSDDVGIRYINERWLRSTREGAISWFKKKLSANAHNIIKATLVPPLKFDDPSFDDKVYAGWKLPK
jgi:hypothetical protein